MKRTSLFHSIVFVSLMILASCGSDNSMSGKAANASSNSNSLTGGECACNAAYSPVCGENQNGVSISYDNSCIASCYKATNVIAGNCECSEATRVCGVDGKDYSECEARYYRVTVKKYGTCSGGSYSSN